MNDETIRKQESESTYEYLQRLCSTRQTTRLSWMRLRDVANNELGWSYSYGWYRTNYLKGTFSRYCDQIDADFSSQAELFEQMRDERVRISDERSQNNALVRRLSRENTLIEIAHDVASQLQDKLLPIPSRSKNDYQAEEAGILLLSDWHYGIECDNYYNKFNPDICKERLRMLLDEVKFRAAEHSLDELVVLNLSDLIAGRIHTTIRIQSRIDVITQTLHVAELLAEFLSELSEVVDVRYYDCLDNHSRLEPNKHESLNLESLVRIIPWHLKARLKDNNCISICDNTYGPDIITCSVLGHNVIGVHGDNDKPATALDKLTLMTHKHYDLLCTAHLHHFNADEKNQSLIISNGSLMGVDSYAEQLRLTSDPSQTLIIATRENVASCIYRIVLKTN